MPELIVLVIVGSIVWIGFDAHAAGRSWGSIIGWVLGALLVWIVAFPWYLVNRRTYARLQDEEERGGRAS